MPSVNSGSGMMKYVKYILPLAILFAVIPSLLAIPQGSTYLYYPNSTDPNYYFGLMKFVSNSGGSIYAGVFFNIPSWSNYNYGFVKLNPDGSVAWSYALQNIDGATTVRAVTTNGTHVWFGGDYYDNSASTHYSWVICFDSNGNVKWAQKYGGLTEFYIQDMLYDNGNLFAVGLRSSSYYMFILKINPNTGAVIAGKDVESTGINVPAGIVKVGSNYAVYGTLSGTYWRTGWVVFDASLNHIADYRAYKDSGNNALLGAIYTGSGAYLVGYYDSYYLTYRHGIIIVLDSSGNPTKFYEIAYSQDNAYLCSGFYTSGALYISGYGGTINGYPIYVLKFAPDISQIYLAKKTTYEGDSTGIPSLLAPYIHGTVLDYSSHSAITFLNFTGDNFPSIYTDISMTITNLTSDPNTYRQSWSYTIGTISPTATSFTPVLKKVIWNVAVPQAYPPPSVSASDQTYTYNYNGVTVYAIVNRATHFYFYRTANDSIDGYTVINSTAKQIYKTYKLPAGTYTITVYARNLTLGEDASQSFTLTINKATPSLSLSLPSSARWMDGFTITASENNMGDNDVVYKVYINDTYLGGLGSYFQKVASGTYTVKFNATEGQNYTRNEVSQSITVLKAWEKTDGIDANKSYYYDLNALAVPVEAYQSDTPANNTVVAGSPLYILSSAVVRNTNGNTGLQDTFTNIYVNISIPSGFKNLSSARKLISSLAYNQQTTTSLYSRAVTVYEKSHSFNKGVNSNYSCTYTLTVNESKYTPQLPIEYVLPSPPNWTNRTNYTITVDGKSSGFTFDPSTLTLVISTSFSSSSLEAGDHVISLTYSLPGGAPSPSPSPAPSPPSPSQNITIGGVPSVPSIPIIPSTPEEGGGAVGGGIVGGIIGGAIGGPAGAVAGAVAGAIVGSTIGELLGSEIGSIIGASGMGGAIIIGALTSIVVGAVAGYLGSVIYSEIVGSVGPSLALIISGISGIIAGILLAIAILFLCVIVPYPYNILLLLLLAVLVLLLLSKKKKKGRKAVAGALALATAIPFVPP